jgi:trans-2,3-dihydro-3-hydroxyanthranilate isomerase
MTQIPFYIVDVFASNKYEGNQLAIFIDLDNRVSDAEMQQMAREINFAETTFIKANKNNERFVVRIFTPEHEIPFAGHPSIGTSYVIVKFMLPQVPSQLVLELAHSDIQITVIDPANIDQSLLFMQQAQPEFREYFTHQEVSTELGIDLTDFNTDLPIQEITTGLPYIIIPLLLAIENLSLQYDTIRAFLEKRNKYRTNSATGHSTSLFFFTDDTYNSDNQYNTRMKLLENGRLSEDAATGSANGCLLAYLLKHTNSSIKATVEQGFQMGRKSFLYLDGSVENDNYVLKIGGYTQLVSTGFWVV